MSAHRNYAIDTKVSVDKTRSEIERLIRQHGGERFSFSDQVTSAIIAFHLGDRLIRLTLPLGHVRGGFSQARTQQLTRSAWRALLLVLKAKLEAIARGIATIEHEFFADTVMPGGQTVREWARPQVQSSLASGQPPLLLIHQSGEGGR